LTASKQSLTSAPWKGKYPSRNPSTSICFSATFSRKGGRAVARLDLAKTGTAENDPPHDEIGHLCSEAQHRSATADLNIVCVRTQAKQLQRPSPLRRKNKRQQARSS